MKIYLIIGLIISLTSCQQKTENVIVTHFAPDKSIRLKDTLEFSIQKTDSLLEYRLTGDTNPSSTSYSFEMPARTDSVVRAWDMKMKLTATKVYKHDGMETEVLRYQYKDGMDGDMTLFLNKVYGPVIVRSDALGGHIIFDKPNDPKRRLINIIISDSLDFGGI